MSRLLTLLAAGDPGFDASDYMPAVKVEVAFTSGYTTPDADRVWTDISEWVELDQGIGNTFGRQDELSTADANQLTLTVDNSDGRFTAGRAASPYYPNVKLGRPIRLSLMTVTGHTSVRHVGFVNQWPVEWDGTDAYAKATITAASRLSRLGLGQKMRSVVEHAVSADAPSNYWTLGDASGATVGSESTGGLPLVKSSDSIGIPAGTEMTFGDATGPGVDALPAASFLYDAGVGGEILRGDTNDLPTLPRTIRCWARLAALPSAFDNTILAAGGGLRLYVDTAGVIHGGVTTGPSINDNEGHDLVLTRDGATERLYVDGTLVDSAAATGSANALAYVGGFTGSLAHVALYETTLDAGQVAVQADAVLTGFAGDTTDERLGRILGWAGVAATEIDTATGDETMTYQLTSGQSVVDALREVESTEGGVLFDGADGRVTFHNRSHRYTAPVAVTLDMEAQQVEADYAPKLDRSTVTNDVTVENPTTGETARSVDTASADEYGTVTSSAKSVADSYDPLQQKAAWLVASYAEPRPRVPSLTVDLLAQVGGTPSAEDILDITIGSRIKVTNQPAQADATEADYFVEGYTEAIGPESYRITFNLSPAHPSLSTFVLEDATRGELDSTYVLAL